MKGLLFAGALGYLIGILWAPKKGALLRSELLQHIEKMQEDGTAIVQGGLDESKHIVSEVSEMGQQLKKTATKKLSVATSAVARAGEIAGESLENLGNNVSGIADQGKNIFSPE